MTTQDIPQANARCLPQSLMTAQEAVQLPEVQEMLRRLSAYQLGIFMPHMHDERTGGFQPLPDDVMQVESCQKTSFRPASEIASQPDRFLPVAWCWRGGASAPSAACEMEDEAGDSSRAVKHKHDGACQTAVAADPQFATAVRSRR